MLKCDFHTYVDSFIDKSRYEQLMNQKNQMIEAFNQCDSIGWIDIPDEELIQKIMDTASMIKENFDCFVVIGIGGSFLGSYAFDKIFQNYFDSKDFEIIYAGTTLSSKYLDELLEYLKDKNFVVNVISKSGTTMETTITYQLLKDLLKRKYADDYKKHIIVTTDKEKGSLREEVNENGYISFEIPEDIGGRYSFITPAHLLPLALHYDLNEIIKGYNRGKRLLDEAYEYAVIRHLMFDSGKVVENFCLYEENMAFFGEWLKQLFGETEGKNRLGILPMSTIHTRDLHSLGQFIQEGNKILFETFIKIEESNHYIPYQTQSLHDVNNIVEDSVVKAHYSGGVPCIEFTLDEMNEETLSSFIYFFQLAAAFSGLLFHVNPFNQPGVEVYKNEVRNSLEEIL
jgi:glucose-6-phosphate isomerase